MNFESRSDLIKVGGSNGVPEERLWNFAIKGEEGGRRRKPGEGKKGVSGREQVRYGLGGEIRGRDYESIWIRRILSSLIESRFSQ